MFYEIIINRESGSGIFREKENQERLKAIFRERGHAIELSVVDPAQLDQVLREKAASEAEVLIVGGGDGTVTAAAKLLQGTGKALGVLPLGTFNLEARHLELSLDPFAAAEELLDAEAVAIDLLMVNDEACLCATVIGFYPTLAKSRESFHGSSWWRKTIRMVKDLATVAAKSPALNPQVTDGGKSLHRRTRLAAFSPGRYEEGIGIIPDRPELASGNLTAYVSSHLSRREMLGAAIGYLTGNLLDTDGMTCIESPQVRIDVARHKTIPAMIDGEIVSMKLPCELRILPGALQVLRPRKDPA